jgi:hypothetical protein
MEIFMIYSVHFHYHKIASNKAEGKFEGIVFAKNPEHAKELVTKMFSDFPVAIGNLSIIGNSEKSLSVIYDERPELFGIPPEEGYIYNEFYYRDKLRKYTR